ncbi:hypothetical protein KIN20_029589 [Parelaphostrongylus tenuis]|uniref:Uncharacterized protein n=1 Tax=Parelaphostrongylus tenuis TaxID=148309 RepID=A0AAD5R2L1_PARTN|nr:hypothetical protein KIN20_029589 [Parelaphostrongylus tenuis]
MKTNGIATIDWYQPRRVCGTAKRFEEIREIDDHPRKGHATQLIYSGEHSHDPFSHSAKSGAFDAHNGKQARNQQVEHQSTVKNMLNLTSHRVSCVHFRDKETEEQWLMKVRQIIVLMACARLSEVLCTDQKIFTVYSLHNRQNRRKPLKNVSRSF